MNDPLRTTFLDRLKRFRLLETALAQQEQLMLVEIPKVFAGIRARLVQAREDIDESLKVLDEDPLNRFLLALQHAEEYPHEATEYGADKICAYLRICKALAESQEPMTIQDLRPVVNGGSRSKQVGSKGMELLERAGFVAHDKPGKGQRPNFLYRLTDRGRELVTAILASY